MSDHADRTPVSSAPSGRPSVWRSKHLWFALLLTALGAGLWIQRVATAPERPTAVSAGDLAAPSLIDQGAAGSPVAAEADGGTKNAPLPFRLGLGLMGGFAIGWALRTFLRITLVVGALIATAIALLRWSGVVEFDWGTVEQSVDAGMQQARAAAEAAESRLMALLPSGLAATYGLWAGWRRG